MLTFWIIVAVLTALAIAFVVPALLKKNPPATDVDRNTLNVAIYKERLAELEQENLTPEQLAQAKQELEKTLAQDLDGRATLANQPRARWATIIVALGIPALAIGWYWELGSKHLITPVPPAETQAAHPQSSNMSSDFNETVNKLAARLQQEPDNEEGWRMLARSYVYLKHYDDAARAYNKLLALVGDQDPELLTDLARVLALSNDGKFTGQATILLKAALELDANHLQALWLLGLAAVEKNNYNAAIEYWQRFLQQVPHEELKTRQRLESNIAEARRQLGQSDAQASTIPTPAATEQDTNQPAPIDAATVAKIEVHVSLDAALQDKVKSNDTLFIYARATAGSPMPLAIVRKSASELPISVTLDDSMAMMPTMKLSNFQEVAIIARVSSNGTAMLQTGDLLGQLSPVVLGKQEKVEIMINRVAP